MNRPITDRQFMASLVCWLVVIVGWLIFLGPQMNAVIDVVANGSFK